MKRRLMLDGPKAPTRFEFFREGFLVGGLIEGEDKGGKPNPRDVVRAETRILNAIDAVSEPAPGPLGPGGVECRKLRSDATELLIAQAEWELIDRYLNRVTWQTPKAREANDMLDWFGAADKLDD